VARHGREPAQHLPQQLRCILHFQPVLEGMYDPITPAANWKRSCPLSVAEDYFGVWFRSLACNAYARREHRPGTDRHLQQSGNRQTRSSLARMRRANCASVGGGRNGNRTSLPGSGLGSVEYTGNCWKVLRWLPAMPRTWSMEGLPSTSPPDRGRPVGVCAIVARMAGLTAAWLSLR